MFQAPLHSAATFDRSANAPPGEGITPWLKLADLEFDPFSPWEASADRRLSAYLVGEEAFTLAWGPWPSIIAAAAGGGKTALRVRVSQECWVGSENLRPFPLSYCPPYQKWGSIAPDFDEHLSALAEAGGRALLFTLAHRTHWFTRLDRKSQRAVRSCLDQTLPGPLDWFLIPSLESGSLEPFYAAQAIAPAFRPPNPPDPKDFRVFCDQLLKTPGAERSYEAPEKRWARLVSVLLNTLHFPSIYLLCDGLDAAPGTIEHPEACMESFLPQAAGWDQMRVYLKLFAPAEGVSKLIRWMPGAQSIHIQWDQDLLAHVIRRRIYKASRGKFGSLASVSVPSLWDLEFQLAGMVEKLPRELLVLCQRIVYEHLLSSPGEKLLQPKDIDAALAWYRQQVAPSFK